MRFARIEPEIWLRPASPLDTSFFSRVDFSGLRNFAEKKSLDVVEEKILSVGIGEIQAVVVDDLCLLLQPPAPARLANLPGNSLSECVGERSVPERGAFVAAVCACDVVSH